ncbi:MAG: GTPase ObgE [Acholeplasma sp.]|jgi:GTP-binding protein|nr:GTPase ObgE [Acholeplasma sp.]
MFKDEVTIKVKGGKGGDGIVAFRREKYVEFGGPAGGSGGAGGSVFFVAEEGMSTLLDLSFNRHLNAKDGTAGLNKSQHGRNAEHLYFKVPIGTVVYDTETGAMLGDLTIQGQTLLLAKGGKGGRGNEAFATHKNPAPEICEKGDLGETKNLRVELKVLADVGLVGYPSVGKSTLISAVSKAKPKIAEYHFTTLEPHLGLVYVGQNKSFVMADLPGLIEGASLGAGLGIQFLKHIERCRVIIHVVEMDGLEEKDPYEDFIKINKELESYNLDLLKRPMIIAASKMDLPNAWANLETFKEKIGNQYEVFPISSVTRQGLDDLVYKAMDLVEKTPKFEVEEIHKNYIKQKEEAFFTIEKAEDGVFVVSGEGLYKLFMKTDFTKEENVKRFSRQLRSYGVDDALRKAGVQNGDNVRVFEYEFEFID